MIDWAVILVRDISAQIINLDGIKKSKQMSVTYVAIAIGDF
ncbi:hypothetical protein [uncultured Nostoc sp.]